MNNDYPLYAHKHKSVLVNQVLEYLNVSPGKTYLDVTFGAGGHTQAILEKEPTCKVIAMDWDGLSIDTYFPPLEEKYGDRISFVWGNFAQLHRALKKAGIDKVDGILADFGTSQMQIVERAGFSIYRNKPLDMRMSPSHQKITAEYLINKATEEKLRDIFWRLGEERHARKIAYAIVEERKKRYIKTTGELADVVERILGKHHKIHPATRVFQALRIYVNKELDNIHAFLPAAIEHLNPSGRLVCISFHSLEDRMVKDFFKKIAEEGVGNVLTKRVVVAESDELRANPSSRSAKLRAFEYGVGVKK
jgi:16S rRNA (cytosine1402-N4)-methyltransferase